ncbi:MAG: rhomboid family intramembrane serine protease [Acidobacteria bacterium]|nr:rhomboid family intramembrane serine protease [Acidobacteriota bacterium]
MVLEARPYRRQPFDRDEKIYLLKVVILIAVIYFFRRELSSLIGFAWMFAPFILFAYVWFKSLNTGDRVIDILRQHITLMPVAYAEGGKKRSIPWATIALVGLNAAVFYAMRPLSAKALEAILNQYCFLPVGQVGWNTLLAPLASLFLHADAVHLWGNMAFLWAFAPSVEERLGTGKFVGLYLLTGVIGGLTHVAVVRLFFSAPAHAIGASGAVAGIMGLFMVRCYFKKLVIPVPVFVLIHAKLRLNSLLILGFFFLRDLNGGFRQLAASKTHVAYWAHIGSMAAGFALALLLRLHAKAAEEKYTEAGLAAMESQFSRRESIDSLLAALQLNPDNQPAMLGLAREYAITRKPEGRELFQRAIALRLRSSPELAMETYGEYRNAYSQMLEAGLQYRLAGAFYRKGEHEPAARLLEAIVLEPSAGEETRQRSFFQLIVLLAENNMLEAAHYRLRQFREQFPDAPLVQAAESKFVEMLKS